MTKKSRKAENPQISEAGTSKYLTCFASFLCSNQQWHQFCSGSCTHWDACCRNYLPDLLNALCIKLLKTLENGAFHLTPHRPRPQNPRWHLCESTAQEVNEASICTCVGPSSLKTSSISCSRAMTWLHFAADLPPCSNSSHLRAWISLVDVVSLRSFRWTEASGEFCRSIFLSKRKEWISACCSRCHGLHCNPHAIQKSSLWRLQIIV